MLRALAPNLWVADHPQTLFGVRLGTRMSVIRLDDGSLWIHSPIPVDEAGKAEIDALGSVRAIVAPSQFHHLHANPALALWPEATLYIAPGLAEKRKDLPSPVPLDDQAPELWRHQIDQVVFKGMPKVNEVVFFHRESKTLLVTDLVFNFQATDHWWTRTFLQLYGMWQKTAMSALFRSNIKDKAAARTAADRILQWDFVRVTVCHGEIIESGGREALAPILASF